MARRSLPHAKVAAARRVLSPDEQWAAGIRERILADCHPAQRDAVIDPSRRISILTGRGAGKTTTDRARAALKITSIRRADVLYLALTEDHARELNWEPMQEMNEHYGLELRFSKSEMVATCARTGGRYLMSGAETDADIERYRGKSRHEVQVDEAASHQPRRLNNLIDKIVGPRLGDKGGCIVLNGSPGHDLRGPFYDATRPGSEHHAPYGSGKSAYWSSHHWSLASVTALPDAETLYPALWQLWQEDLLEKEKKGWSDDHPTWQREYLGIWAADDIDRVYRGYRPHLPDGTPGNQWDPWGDGRVLEGIQMLKHCIAAVRAMPEHKGLADWRFIVSYDMGSSDAFAASVFMFAPADPRRRLWQVFNFEQVRMYARPIAAMTIGLDDRGDALHDRPEGIIGVTGYPDGMVFDADQSTIDELKNPYGLRFDKADRHPLKKKGAIELTNGDFNDDRIKVIKGSKLEEQLIQLQWMESGGNLKENTAQANHSTDTLLYARTKVAALYESGVIESENVRPPDPHYEIAPPARMHDDDPPAARGEDHEIQGLLAGSGYVDIWGNG